jgi:hypothetical protein
VIASTALPLPNLLPQPSPLLACTCLAPASALRPPSGDPASQAKGEASAACIAKASVIAVSQVRQRGRGVDKPGAPCAGGSYIRYWAWLPFAPAGVQGG